MSDVEIWNEGMINKGIIGVMDGWINEMFLND